MANFHVEKNFMGTTTHHVNVNRVHALINFCSCHCSYENIEISRFIVNPNLGILQNLTILLLTHNKNHGNF